MMNDAEAFCRDMLPKVSRTFAACIGFLPPGLEYAVLVAYLMCRVADTIEDHPGLDPVAKAGLLARWRSAIRGDPAAVAEIRTAFATPQDDDQVLAGRADLVVAAFLGLSTTQQQAIRPPVDQMCLGMADMGRTHPPPTPGTMSALDSLDDLDRYCYFVAGTVGHLLTDLFRINSYRLRRRHYLRMKALATSFGLGLQLVNIIKDVADDARRGWSFVPRDLCQAEGIAPEHLLDPAQAGASRRVMAALIAKAAAHLDDAFAYCLTIPRSQYRVRVFCLTPLFFAVRTLRLAGRDPRLLDPGHKVKISRVEVKRLVRLAFVIASSNCFLKAVWRRLSAKGGSTVAVPGR